MSGFDVNQVTISGRLTHDPELRSLPSGKSVCRLRLAHNERRKDQNSGEWTDVPGFYDVDVWGGLGEWIADELHKGSKVVVAGRLMWREFETQDDPPRKRTAVSITADTVIPVPGRSSDAATDFEPAAEPAAF